MRVHPSVFRKAAIGLLMAGWLGSPALAQSPQESDQTVRKPPNVLRGRVLDHHGKPVQGAVVAVSDAEAGWLSSDGQTVWAFAESDTTLLFFRKTNGRRAAKTRTRDDGTFEIRNLKHSRYHLLVLHRKKGSAFLPEQVFSPEKSSWNVRLDPPTFLEAGIASPDVPVPFCGLEARNLPQNVQIRHPIDLMETADRGRFLAGPLCASLRWSLKGATYVPEYGYTADLFDIPVPLRAGEKNRIELSWEGGHKLSGEVRGPKGEPLQGVSVVAKAAGNDGWSLGGVTDAKGRYTIRGLRDGPHSLTAKRHAVRTAPG